MGDIEAKSCTVWSCTRDPNTGRLRNLTKRLATALKVRGIGKLIDALLPGMQRFGDSMLQCEVAWWKL